MNFDIPLELEDNRDTTYSSENVSAQNKFTEAIDDEHKEDDIGQKAIKKKRPYYTPKRGLPAWDDKKLIDFVEMYEEDKSFTEEYYEITASTATTYYFKAKNEIRHRNLKVK